MRRIFCKNFVVKQKGKFLGALLLALTPNFGQSAKADIIGDMSFGYRCDTLYFINTHSVFFGYKPIPFLGIKIGIGYGNEILACVSKEIELLNLVESSKKFFDKRINTIDRNFLDQNEVDALSSMLNGVQGNATTDGGIDDLMTKVSNKIKSIRDNALQKADATIENDIDGAWGFYSVKLISIPLKLQIFPFGGAFAINFGMKVDCIISVGEISASGLLDKAKNSINTQVSDKYINDTADKYKQEIKAKRQQYINNPSASLATARDRDLKKIQDKLQREIDIKSQKIKGEVENSFDELKEIFKVEKPGDILDTVKELEKREKDEASVLGSFNRTRVSAVLGLEHTFPFGLLIGVEGTWYLTDFGFVKYKETESKMLLPGILHLSIGFDIARFIGLCTA